MLLRLTTALSFMLLLIGQASYAQYAFNSHSPAPAHYSEESPKAPSYKTVHGVVQGARGSLPGATVWLRATNTLAVTNAEGEFELRVPADAKIVELTCSYAGLQDEVVQLAPVQALGSVYLLRSSTQPGR